MEGEARSEGERSGRDARAASRRGSRGRRLLRRAARATVWLLALLALLIGGLYLYVVSGPGERRLQRALEGALDDRLTGEASIDSVEITASLAIEVRGLEVLDRTGRTVLAAELLSGRLHLPSLLQRTVRITHGRLESPYVWLEKVDGRLSLLRALSPKPDPKDETRSLPPGDEGSPPSIVLEPLQVSEGVLEATWEGGNARLAALRGPVAVSLGGSDNDVSASIDWRGRLTVEGDAERSIHLEALLDRRDAGPLYAKIDLRVDESGVLGWSRFDFRSFEVVLESLRVEPSVARLLVPGWPLEAPLVITGHGARAMDGELTAGLVAEAGNARVGLLARGVRDDDTPGALLLSRLAARIERFDPSSLFEGVPKGALDGRLFARDVRLPPLASLASPSAHLGDSGSPERDGALRLRVAPSSTLGGVGIGPIELTAHERPEGWGLEVMEGVLPGADLAGSAFVARTGAYEAELALDVRSLEELWRLSSIVGPPEAGEAPAGTDGQPAEPQGVGGSGRPEATPPDGAAPAGEGTVRLKLDGRLWPASSAPLRVEPPRIEVSASFPTLEVPGLPEGSAELELKTPEGGVTLSLALAGFPAVALEGELSRIEEGTLLELETLSLDLEPVAPWAASWGEWRLSSESANALFLGQDGVLTFDGLTLKSGGQRIGLEGRVETGRGEPTVALSAELSALALDPLAELVPALPRVEGELGGTLQLSGALKQPDVRLDLDVDLRLATLTRDPLDVKLQLASSDGRAQVQVGVWHEGQDLLTSRLRLDWGARELRELTDLEVLSEVGLEGRLRLGPHRLGPLLALRFDPDVAEGEPSPPWDDLEALWGDARARLELRLSGSLGAPQVALDAALARPEDLEGEASGLAGALPALEAFLTARWGAEGLTWAIELEGEGYGKLLSRGELAAAPPSIVEPDLAFGEAPLRAQLSSERFRIDALRGLVPSLELVEGELSGRLELGGTLESPELKGGLELDRGRFAIAGIGEYFDIKLRADGQGRTVRIRELSGHAGSGGLVTSGRLTWMLDGGIAVEADGEAFRFPIRGGFRTHGALTARLRLDGRIGPDRTELYLTSLDRGRFALPEAPESGAPNLSGPEGLVRVETQEELDAPLEGLGTGGTGEAPGELASGVPSFVLSVLAKAPLEVVGPGLEAVVVAEEAFRLEEVAGAWLLFGELRVAEGGVIALGRRFDLLEGSILRFAGPMEVPYLEIMPLDGRRDEERAVAVRVSAEASGGGDAFRYETLFDGEPMAVEHLYANLSLGRGAFPAGRALRTVDDPTAFAGSAAGSFAARLLWVKLPLPLFVPNAGDSDLSTRSVESEAPLTRRLAVGYSEWLAAQRAYSESQSTVWVNYRLLRWWSLQAAYGDGDEGSLELLWDKDF